MRNLGGAVGARECQTAAKTRLAEGVQVEIGRPFPYARHLEDIE